MQELSPNSPAEWSLLKTHNDQVVILKSGNKRSLLIIMNNLSDGLPYISTCLILLSIQIKVFPI